MLTILIIVVSILVTIYFIFLFSINVINCYFSNVKPNIFWEEKAYVTHGVSSSLCMFAFGPLTFCLNFMYLW